MDAELGTSNTGRAVVYLRAANTTAVAHEATFFGTPRVRQRDTKTRAPR